MNISSLSFFNHDDFIFATPEEEPDTFSDENRDPNDKSENRNTMDLILPVQKAVQGKHLIGVIKMYVRKRLPKGTLFLNLDSNLDIKFREESGKPMDQQIKILQGKIPQSKINTKSPTGDRQSLLNRIYASKRKPRVSIKNPLDYYKKVRSTTRNLNQNLNKISAKSKIRDDGNSNDPNNPQKSQAPKNEINNFFSFKRIKVTPLTSTQILQMSLANRTQCKKLQVLGLEKKIFTFSHDINQKSIFLIPFQINIPSDFKVSYQHKLNLSSCIDLKKKIKSYYFNFKKPDIRSVSTNKIEYPEQINVNSDQGESVTLTHNIRAYFVPQTAIQILKNLGVKSNYTTCKDRLKFFQDYKFFQFTEDKSIEIFKKEKKSDFKAYSKTSKIVINGPSILESLSKSFCFCFKNKKVKVVDVPILKLNLDKRVFRKTDKSINCVISYSNKILQSFDYLEVILICKYQIQHNRILDLQILNNRDTEDSDLISKPLIKIQEEPKFIKSELIQTKKMVGSTGIIGKLKSKSLGKKTPIKSSQSNIPTQQRVSTVGIENVENVENNINYDKQLSKELEVRRMDSNISSMMKDSLNGLSSDDHLKPEDLKEPQLNDQKLRKFDIVLYHQSVDLIGKRIIKQDELSEQVHRIPIGEDYINTSLETVSSEFISINYELQFYLSQGKMTFKQKVKEIPIVFQNSAQSYQLINKDSIRHMNKFFEQRIRQNRDAFMLPFSRITLER